MTHLTRQDSDLHHADGSHRSTPPSTAGRVLESHERRIRAHLAHHQSLGQVARLLDEAASTLPNSADIACGIDGHPQTYAHDCAGWSASTLPDTEKKEVP